jgi:hypothetical protein
VGGEEYFAAKYQETRSYVAYFLTKRNSYRNLILDCGMAGLIAARTGGLMTAYRAAKAGLIDDDALQMCPCCEKPCRESLEHILLHCSAWEDERAETLALLLQRLPSGSMTATAKCRILLGGSAMGWSFGSAWCDGEGDSLPLFLYVVKFFALIKRRRSKLVWSWATRPGAEAPVG